ncbi:MAG: hypothetical protein ACRDLP_02625 [Solirubrobacteraceae bacterium]
MLVIRSDHDVAEDSIRSQAEASVREARRRHRRRVERRRLLGVVVLAAAVVLAVLIASSERSPSAGAAAAAGVLPNGSLATLHLAGPLAVAPDGVLYLADDPNHAWPWDDDRVIVRLPGGRFRVVAGTGKGGFSGDGGPAVRAELSSVSDLAFAADGTLFIADGGRVRAVSRDGMIRTIAGDGRPSQGVASGTPALAAGLGSGRPVLHIALSPGGHLYIATGSQILRLTAAATLDVVRAAITSGRDRGLGLGGGPIAVDAQGNIDVGGGPSGWGVWQVTPNGIAHLASGAMYAHGNGGAPPILRPGPGDAIYTAAGSLGIFRVALDKLVPIAAYNGPLSRPLHGQGLPLPLYFAFSSNGTLYADDEPYAVYDAHQQLWSISNGAVSLVWQATNRNPN